MAGLLARDFHVHTNLSACAHPDASPRNILRAAQEAGLEALGISDHIVYSEDWGRPALVRSAMPSRLGDLRIYIGCEAEMASPTESKIDAEYASRLDFVIMSASHLFNPGVQRPPSLDPRAMASYMLAMIDGAVALGFVDIIAHPLSVPMSPVPFPELVAAADVRGLRRTAALAARAGVAIEYNPRYLRAAPEETAHLYAPFLEAGCKLAVNSDAHHPSQIGCRGPEYATEEEIRAMGIAEDNLWRIEERGPRRPSA